MSVDRGDLVQVLKFRGLEYGYVQNMKYDRNNPHNIGVQTYVLGVKEFIEMIKIVIVLMQDIISHISVLFCA